MIGLYTDPDGTLSQPRAQPAGAGEPASTPRPPSVSTGADLALVFDGDADRCFIIDERGEVVSPSAVTAMIASQRAAPRSRVPQSSSTRSPPGRCRRSCATPAARIVITKVGHTFVKAAMAEHNAIFGGEHSAHYYFRDFWGADTGMLAALHVLAAGRPAERPLSRIGRRDSPLRRFRRDQQPGRGSADDHGPGGDSLRRAW